MEATLLAQEIGEMIHLFTEEIDPAVRPQVLHAIAGAEHIGHNDWKNLGLPCLFALAYEAASGAKVKKHKLGFGTDEGDVAKALGISRERVVWGYKTWDKWGRIYPGACKLFQDEIRRHFDEELARGYRENAKLNRQICEEFRHTDAETAAMIDE